jgi:hypothetical protein
VPLIVALALLLGVILLGIMLMPLTLVQRYRMGTSRQQARGWLITINVVGLTLSCVMFLGGAAMSNIWVPNAFRYSVLGLAGGIVLGFIGLALTRWEPTPRALHYTPNRLLVLLITLTISGRLIYSFWRAWQTWRDRSQRMARDVGRGRGTRSGSRRARLLPGLLVRRSAASKAARTSSSSRAVTREPRCNLRTSPESKFTTPGGAVEHRADAQRAGGSRLSATADPPAPSRES